MQANECFICGSNNFTVTDGAFICSECGIQSQVSFQILFFYFTKRILQFLKVKSILTLKRFLFQNQPNISSIVT